MYFLFEIPQTGIGSNTGGVLRPLSNQSHDETGSILRPLATSRSEVTSESEVELKPPQTPAAKVAQTPATTRRSVRSKKKKRGITLGGLVGKGARAEAGCAGGAG